MQYILVKGNIIKVNPHAVYRVKCIGFKGQILGVAFIQGQRLWLYLHSILQLLSEGGYYEGCGH